MCVIWSFDDMGLGEQVILSDKGNRETEQIINIGKVIIFWNRDGRMFYVKDYRLCFFKKNIRDIRSKCNRQFSVGLSADVVHSTLHLVYGFLFQTPARIQINSESRQGSGFVMLS